MNITTEEFEKAVKIGFDHGAKNAHGWNNYLLDAAIAEAHDAVSTPLPAPDGQRNPAAEEGVTNHD